MNNIDFMKTIPDNYYSIGITDIPYGINVGKMAFVKETKTLVRQKNGSLMNPNKKKKLQPCEWDNKIPDIEWWNEFKRITKHQIFFGVDYVNWEDLGTGRIKWNKGFAEGMSFSKYETAYCSFIDYTHEIDYLWAGMMQGRSKVNPMVQQGNKRLNEIREHPSQKPIILWDLILDFCFEKNIMIENVVDTFCGLCSLSISCDKIGGVKFDGVDITKDYIDKSLKRIQTYLSTKNTLFD